MSRLKDHAHYIFVRRDIPVGLVAAMVTHAAGESLHRYHTSFEYSGDINYGLPKNTAAVVLAADNESHLERILSYLIKEDIAFKAIHEVGGTYDGQLMSIGLIPCSRYIVKDKLRGFSLLKELDDAVLPQV